MTIQFLVPTSMNLLLYPATNSIRYLIEVVVIPNTFFTFILAFS